MSGHGGNTVGTAVPEPRLPSRDEVIGDAGSWLADALDTLDSLSPREAANRAHKPYGPSVDELEARIRADRGLPPIDQAGAA